MYRNYFKRLLDVIFATIGFIVAFPLFCICFISLTLANHGKAFFYQMRPGEQGRLFRIIKFKTMSDLRGDDGELLPDHIRLTSVGKFIRKTSLDEIPQLLNVILGDMSLVGPRPLLPEYLQLYSEEQFKRHNVRPGVTGWAQVNGRNTLSWEKKFEYDVWYVDHVSFSLDIKILFLTVVKVVKKEGISSDTSVTMEKFKGNS